MVIAFFIIGGLIVFAIAAAFVGTETFRLGHTPSATIFDMDEAVLAVGDRLTDEVAAGLTYDELRQLIGFCLDHLREKGISALPGEELEISSDDPPVVVADDDALAVVMGRADEAEMVVTDDAVLQVLDLLLAHLVDIGAVGPAVPPPVDPDISD